jgi:hypothetical protein
VTGGTGTVVIVTTIVAEALLPPASWAVIVIVFVPATRGTVTLQEVPPGTVPLCSASAFCQEIDDTPTLSDALPLIVIGPIDAVAVGGAGFTIVRVGGAVSPLDPTMSVTVRVPLPNPFVVFVKVTVSV